MRSEAKKYRHSAAVTELHDFPDRAHSLIMDSGWRAVADDVLAWLEAQHLAPERPPVPAPRQATEESAAAPLETGATPPS